MSKVALGRMLHFRDSTNCRTRKADHKGYSRWRDVRFNVNAERWYWSNSAPCCAAENVDVNEGVLRRICAVCLTHFLFGDTACAFTFSLSLSLRFPFLYNSGVCSRCTCTVEQWLMWRFCAVPCGVSCPPPPPNQLGAVTNDCAIGCIR